MIYIYHVCVVYVLSTAPVALPCSILPVHTFLHFTFIICAYTSSSYIFRYYTYHPHTVLHVIYIIRIYIYVLYISPTYIFTAYTYLRHICSLAIGWQGTIRCLKMQVSFRKRTTNYRALLRKETYEDKASCRCSPPCIYITCVHTHMLL